MVLVAVAGEPWESNRTVENQKASEMLMNIFIQFLKAGYRQVGSYFQRIYSPELLIVSRKIA